jgi:protein-S-isoprenylcysteine O-methyltransferase Ste14
MSADTSTVRHIAKQIDGERLILVPLLSGLLFLNVVSTFQHLTGTETFGAHEVLTAVYKALIVAFYVLLLVLLFIRTKAKDAGRNWRGTAAAYFGTFAPMILLGVAGTGTASPLRTLVSIAVMTAGMAFSVYAVTHLGRSFGAVPRARNLVRSGPYGLVRHPLYVGEIVTFFGAILVDLSAVKIGIFLLLVAVQAYRALQEEKVLTEVFPEYRDYAATTSRFIPRVV